MNLPLRAGDKASSCKLEGVGWDITKRQEKSGWTSVKNGVSCCHCSSGICIVSEMFCLLFYWIECVSALQISYTTTKLWASASQIQRQLLGCNIVKCQFLSLDQMSWSAFSTRTPCFKELAFPTFTYRKYKWHIFRSDVFAVSSDC